MILKKCGSDSGYFSKAHGNCFVRLNENMYWPVLYSRDELASTFLSQLDTVFRELNHFEQVLKMKSDKYVFYNNYRMAQEEITTSDTIYEDNYWNMLLEMESRLAGKRRVEELIKSLGDNYEFKDLLEQILESKYKRRFEMLEMYQDGRYEEGYELINYNLQKGVDVPLREDNVSDVENNIRHLFVREKFIDVYNKTESEIDFKNREFNEDVKISYVLNAVATGKIPSRLFHRIARTFPRFTRNNFKELAAVFKVAEDLTLPGEKNYVTDLYNIPDVQKIVEKMFESDVYKKIVEESKLSSQPERKTQLDLDYEIAEQNVMDETYAILLAIYRDDFATENQKKILNTLLIQNFNEKEEEKKEKYTKYQELHGDVHRIEESAPEVALVSVEKKWYTKVFEFVKRMLGK